MIGQNYLLSLPERALRSAAALVGGTTLLLTETLLPDVLKETTTYRLTIGDMQRFLITRLAEMQPEEQAFQERMSDAYLRKKVVGSTLEAIGLLTMRFSPVWVFAIAGDAAGGSKVFLYRLTDNLKANDVIAQDASPESLAELLNAMQTASFASAAAIDTPPLSGDELVVVADDLTSDYGRIFSNSQSLLSRFDIIWSKMEQVALQEDISIEHLSGVMTTNAAALAKTGLAFGKTGTELFGENILDSYAQTLDGISREGVGSYFSRNFLPFLQTAVAHLDPNKTTWTESTLLESKLAE